MKLYLENVRSFEGWHEIPIAPVTVLLGENSAGKSTLLGMLSVVHQTGFPFSGNFFNQFPFEFGGFKTLANTKKGIGHFSVGFQAEVTDHFGLARAKPDKKTVSIGLIVAFRENDGLPVPGHIFGWCDDFAFALYEKEFRSLDRAVQIPTLNFRKVDTVETLEAHPQGLSMQMIRRSIYERGEKQAKLEKSDRSKSEALEFFLHQLFIGGLRRVGGQSALAFAPMRSRPKRTYDQLSDEFTPEGDHVPLLLARATDPANKQANALHAALRDFGRYSEMFTDVGVKKLGRGSGDPFQVQVKIGSKSANLMDVGYGVSQILPLIVDAQRIGSDAVLLLQQPEVHLHPKAQAALGSMIKDWVSKSKKTVVVETHSDYLVDRLRLEVKQSHLRSEDLKIFYLEKKGSSTKLHVLEVDKEGNVLNAPPGYRDFFLLEQLALLGD
jgi:AAA ATPase domain